MADAEAAERAAVFVDPGPSRLSPLDDLRASFDVRTGALTGLERMCIALGLDLVGLFVPDELLELVAERHDFEPNRFDASAEEVLIVNGRCHFPLAAIDELELGCVLIEASSGQAIAARAGGKAARDAIEAIRELRVPSLRVVELEDEVLLRRPWDWRRVRDVCIDTDLELLSDLESAETPDWVGVVGEHNVIVHPSARLYPGVVLDAEQGPIIISEDATIRPGAVVCGPAYVGERSSVLDRSVIRPHTAIGPVCKVAGEVSGCVFQGYANKAHDGFLGDSWVGEWVNLGAGTTNSNLLNTYGEITCRATPDSPRERTGQTFLGATIGDHFKSAIGTRIMTGAVIHTGCMWAAGKPIADCLDRFSWVTDEGARRYQIGKFLDVARAAMKRREALLSKGAERRLKELHDSATTTSQ